MISSLPLLFLISQAQPLPKRLGAGVRKFFLERVEAAERGLDVVSQLPDGSPPAFGPMIFQKKE